MDAKALYLSLIAFFTLEDHQASGYLLMRLGGIEDLAALSTKKVKSASAEKKGKSISLLKDR